MRCFTKTAAGSKPDDVRLMDERPSALFSRRSVRKYSGEPVSAADLEALLQAGMAAPSASNRKPWHFVTVAEQAKLDELAANHPHGKMLAGAGLCIAACGDRDISPDFWAQDCCAATENILVAATMLCLIAVGHPAERPAARTQYDENRVHRGRW